MNEHCVSDNLSPERVGASERAARVLHLTSVTFDRCGQTLRPAGFSSRAVREPWKRSPKVDRPCKPAVFKSQPTPPGSLAWCRTRVLCPIRFIPAVLTAMCQLSVHVNLRSATWTLARQLKPGRRMCKGPLLARRLPQRCPSRR